MNKMIQFLRNWTLPVAMAVGVAFYALMHNIAMLQPLHAPIWAVDAVLTPSLIFIQLLLTFCKVDPRQFRLKWWHLWLIMIQLLGSIGAYMLLAPVSPTLAQGAMICLICPTATAAAVITAKLGGSAETLITYTFMVNIQAAIFVPLVFPVIHPQEGVEFISAFLRILSKVFPLLIFPFILSQILKYLFPRIHGLLATHSGVAFYVWAIALAMVMGKTAKSIVDDSSNTTAIVMLGLISLVACGFQFAIGKKIGTRYRDRISAGQAIGQKNTVLAIWMSQTYLEPISCVAPGTYVLWQNIVNSYQLWKKNKRH